MLGFADQWGSLLDRATRREALALGGLGACALATSASAVENSPPPTARALIFLALFGGPPHQDTYDLKPEAPAEIRGEFQPIATTLPGFHISEYMPKLAKLAHLYTIIRSVTHRDNGHESAFYSLMCGRPHLQPNTIARPDATDFPCYGSAISYLQPPAQAAPGFVLTGGVTSTGIGQNGGFLRPSWSPYVIKRDAHEPDFHVPEFGLLNDVPLQRMRQRRELLSKFDPRKVSTESMQPGADFTAYQQRAFDMLSGPQMRRAFDIGEELPATRQAYGNHPFGQNLLLCRRLVEAGVPVVQVNYRNRGDGGVDTHSNNFNTCKGNILPKLDGCISALLIDLEERGLLDQTLVVAAGEFGRTPQINANAGRDHWAGCNSVLLAGGGIRRGLVFGSSNRTAAYPATNPVGPWDLYATIMHCCGIDPHSQIPDSQGRLHPLCTGRVIEDVLRHA